MYLEVVAQFPAGVKYISVHFGWVDHDKGSIACTTRWTLRIPMHAPPEWKIAEFQSLTELTVACYLDILQIQHVEELKEMGTTLRIDI